MKFKINLKFKIKNLKFQKGVAALITILSLGGLVMTIAMGMAAISFWTNQSIYSNRNSNKTFYAAYSGIQDTLLKLERNKDLSSGNFNLSIYNTNDVSVSITNSSGLATINATSSVNQVNKKLQAIINIDTTTGLITPSSTMELAL